MIKKYFNKDNFINASFDEKQKRQSLFVSALLIVIFIFSSFTFFNALYCFVDVAGSIVSGSLDVGIRDLLRILPIILSAFMSIWAMLLIHATYRNVSEERRLRSYKKNAITLIAFAGFNILFIIIMRMAGGYLSFLEGSPSASYPLDALLYSILYLGIGVFMLLYLRDLKDKIPYLVPSRGPIVNRCRFLYCFGVSIWMLVSLFTFSGFLFGLFIIDFRHGHQFYAIMLLIAYLISFLFLCIWEFYYNQLIEEKRRKFLFPLAIVGLVVSLIIIILYFIALGTDLDAPSNIGFGVLPVAFTASVNLGTLVVVFTPLIVSIVALIKGIIARKRK